jgi:hypothetical protein
MSSNVKASVAAPSYIPVIARSSLFISSQPNFHDGALKRYKRPSLSSALGRPQSIVSTKIIATPCEFSYRVPRSGLDRHDWTQSSKEVPIEVRSVETAVPCRRMVPCRAPWTVGRFVAINYILAITVFWVAVSSIDMNDPLLLAVSKTAIRAFTYFCHGRRSRKRH